MANNKIDDIIAKLDEGVKSLFDSEKYAEYLSVMARFHNYSLRNTVLIYLQRPNATHCAGFQAWRQNFNRTVKKGEKGIQILAPVVHDETKDFEKLDPVTKMPIIDENGQPVMETLMNTRISFKPVYVFDILQTQGEPLPELAETLTGDVERYELFMDALRAVSPLPIVFEPLANKDGYCAYGDKIAIREGMSQVQTVVAAIHEICHSLVHDKNSVDFEGTPKSKAVVESEAEGSAFVICKKFNIDTDANSLGYIASYQKDKDAKALREHGNSIYYLFINKYRFLWIITLPKIYI